MLLVVSMAVLAVDPDNCGGCINIFLNAVCSATGIPRYGPNDVIEPLIPLS